MQPKNVGAFPIHLAITGHRDIPKHCEAGITQQLRDFLQTTLLSVHSATPFKLLTGLAEGADRLAAQLAIELGIGLIAVLPLPQHDYETDFTSTESLTNFRHLLALCDTVIAMPSENRTSRDEGYVKQGVFMVENAQVLLAMWDGYGLENGATVAPGGTADVVRMALEGTPAHNDDRILNAKHATWVHHVATQRTRNDEAKNNSIQLLNPTLQSAVKTQTLSMFDSINRLNQTSLTELGYRAHDQTPSIQQSLDWLLGGSLAQAQSHQPLLNAYAVADTLAGTRQTKRIDSIKKVTALALLSILFQQIYSGPDMSVLWIALHIGFAGAAFYFYKRFFDGRSQHEAQYLEWRVLAESLRVQIFWKLAGIRKPVHTAYYTNRPSEVEWIVQTLINLDTAYSGAQLAPTRLATVQKHWVQNQADYFIGKQNKAALNAAYALRFNKRVKFTFGTALALTCATLVCHAAGMDNEQLNYLVLASGMSFVIAAVLSSYADQMGFDENAKRYDSMGKLFQFAKSSVDTTLVNQDHPSTELIISHLGVQAVQENLSWFQQHRMNAYKVQVA